MSPEQMQAFQQMMSQGGGGMPGMGPGGMGGPPSTSSGVPSTTSIGGPPAAPAETKEWISLYPIYFDAKRSHKTGERRVTWAKSSLYPHSLGLAKALQRLGLRAIHEPGKTHPRDWENPGRVKVRVFDEDGKAVASVQGKTLQNRRQLLEAVAPVLQQFCGGAPPLELPKREKKAPRIKKKTSAEAGTAKKGAKEAAKGSTSTATAKSTAPKTGKPASTSTSTASKDKDAAGNASASTSKGPHLPNAGSSSRLAKLNRVHLLRPHLPPAHIRLPPHSPALSANLLNMDLNAAMGGAPGGGAGALPGGPGGAGGAANPMGALGSMMGNLGFGQEDEQGEEEETEEEKRKKAQNDPFKGIGRRGRKRVVRVGR